MFIVHISFSKFVQMNVWQSNNVPYTKFKVRWRKIQKTSNRSGEQEQTGERVNFHRMALVCALYLHFVNFVCNINLRRSNVFFPIPGHIGKLLTWQSVEIEIHIENIILLTHQIRNAKVHFELLKTGKNT